MELDFDPTVCWLGWWSSAPTTSSSRAWHCARCCCAARRGSRDDPARRLPCAALGKIQVYECCVPSSACTSFVASGRAAVMGGVGQVY